MANVQYIVPVVPKHYRRLQRLTPFHRLRVRLNACFSALWISTKYGGNFDQEYIEKVEALTE